MDDITPSTFHPLSPLLLFLTIVIAHILLVHLIKHQQHQLIFPRTRRLLPRWWWRPRCRCSTCHAYVTTSWATEFPNLSDWYTHLLRQSPTRTVQVHVLGALVTANPANVEHVLRWKFDNYPKGKPFSTILGDFLGRGIFNVDGDTWRFQRKLASRELDSVSVRKFAFEIIQEEIESRLLPLVSSVAVNDRYTGDVLDLQDVFRRFAFDCICKFSFGLDPECLNLNVPLSDFAVAFDLASKLSAERALTISPLVWKLKRLLNLGSERQLKKSLKVIKQLGQEVIRQRRSRMNHKQYQNREVDLLSRFMENISDETYLIDIVISFLLAGRDTVASALVGFFWLITDHPEVESAILAETDRVLGPNQQLVVRLERIRELHYLQAAVYESMRLYPPVQFDSKYCVEDDVLPDGTRVEKGTRVTYHPYAMGRMEDIWGKDCLEFKPERWLKKMEGDDDEKVGMVFCQESVYKYPVFQGGIRVCLGKEMALMEIKCVVLSLLRNFHIELADDGEVQGTRMPPRFSPGLTAIFKDGMRVVFRSRCTNDHSPAE